MIHRRREGEYHRVGVNWQWDRWNNRLWMALALRIPYWITQFTIWDDRLYKKKRVVSLQKNVCVGIAYAWHSKRLHLYRNTYKQVWREFNAR